VSLWEKHIQFIKKHKLHAYRPTIIQHLIPGDFDIILTFIAWLTCKFKKNHYYSNMFDGLMSQNSLIMVWSTNKITATGQIIILIGRIIQTFSMCGEQCWCVLLCGKLLGPYFYDGTLTSKRYLDFLSNTLSIFLDEFNLDTLWIYFSNKMGLPPIMK